MLIILKALFPTTLKMSAATNVSLLLLARPQASSDVTQTMDLASFIYRLNQLTIAP
jgi:hypothetical protein